MQQPATLEGETADMDARTLLAAVQQYLQDQLAEFLPHQPSGMARAEILIHMPDGQTNKLTGYIPLLACLPSNQRYAGPAQEVPPARVQASAPRVTVEQHAPAASSQHPIYDAAFEPNEYQDKILGALEFRALRAEELVEAIGGGDRRRLWKAGGIKELIAAGWVRIDKKHKLGYYRPDVPPDEVSEE